jgi:uncharacterized membrane protein YhaH (DUF805 family)
MDWIYLFTSFHGRISRQPFWIAFAILMGGEIGSELLASHLKNDTLGVLLDLAITYPEFAVAVKRSNDRNLPPWLVSLFFGGNVALDLFMLLNGPLDPESTLAYITLYPLSLMQLFLLLEFGFRRGTDGPNRFGDDPLAAGKPVLLHQYAAFRRLDDFVHALTPEEPFIYRVQGELKFQEELPRSVKHWCFVITAVNALIFLVTTVQLRSFVPALVFTIFIAAVPVYLMLGWKRMIRHLNNELNKQRVLDLGFTLSIEWCAIMAMVPMPLFMIVLIFALSPH